MHFVPEFPENIIYLQSFTMLIVPFLYQFVKQNCYKRGIKCNANTNDSRHMFFIHVYRKIAKPLVISGEM